MFLALVDWGMQAEAGVSRRLAFFHAVDGLASTLKGLFVPYFSNIIKPMADILAVWLRDGV